MDLSADQVQVLLDCIRSHVSTTKRPPDDADLVRFYFDALPHPRMPALRDRP
jgi:hypothetical protein